MEVATVRVSEPVSRFVATKKKMLIGGKWVEAISGKTFATYNPATGEALAHVAEGDTQDIDVAVKAARAAFRGRAMAKADDLGARPSHLEAGRPPGAVHRRVRRAGIARQRKARGRGTCGGRAVGGRSLQIYGWMGHED